MRGYRDYLSHKPRKKRGAEACWWVLTFGASAVNCPPTFRLIRAKKRVKPHGKYLLLLAETHHRPNFRRRGLLLSSASMETGRRCSVDRERVLYSRRRVANVCQEPNSELRPAPGLSGRDSILCSMQGMPDMHRIMTKVAVAEIIGANFTTLRV